MKSYLKRLRVWMLLLLLIRRICHKKSIWSEFMNLAGHHKVVTTAIIEEKGIDELEEAISDLFFTGSIEADDMTYVSNSRHIALLDQAYRAIE